MFTRLYGLPKERQTGFSTMHAVSTMRKLRKTSIIAVRFYCIREVWVWFPVCPFIRGTFVQS